jgi:hypothetical protein
MPDFRVKPGTKSAFCRLKTPLADVAAFDEIIQALIHKNPLGCTSYYARQRHHQPIEKVREMYTARFEYRNVREKRIGTTIEMYDSVEGYETGVAAVISNMANIASHRAKVRHLKKADLFSVMLRCHDPVGEIYFLNMARDRMTLSSYSDDAIRERLLKWTNEVPELA